LKTARGHAGDGGIANPIDNHRHLDEGEHTHGEHDDEERRGQVIAGKHLRWKTQGKGEGGVITIKSIKLFQFLLKYYFSLKSNLSTVVRTQNKR